MSLAELTNAAAAASSELSYAELHGTVCGTLVANIRASGAIEGRVHFSVEEYVELVGADAVTDAQSVEDFAELSLSQLDAVDLTFQLLLPDDNEPLAARVEALGEWCAAFLAGVGAASESSLNETESEVLDDFVAISAVETDVADTEEGEQQLMELVEYVRVAVLSLLAPGEGDDE